MSRRCNFGVEVHFAPFVRPGSGPVRIASQNHARTEQLAVNAKADLESSSDTLGSLSTTSNPRRYHGHVYSIHKEFMGKKTGPNKVYTEASESKSIRRVAGFLLP